MNISDLDRVVRERIIGSPPHSLQLMGTIERVRYVGTIGRFNRMGTIQNVQRVGTQQYLGTVNRLGGGRLGSIGYLGTARYLGTVNRVGAVQESIFSPVSIRDKVPLGPGSVWGGSWQHVGSYSRWAFAMLSRGGGGSFAVVGGALGTSNPAGTIYGYAPVRGSVQDLLPPALSVGALPIRYVSPVFRRTGNSRGTVSVHLVRRV